VVNIEAEGVVEESPVSKSGFVQIGKPNGNGVLSEPPASAGGGDGVLSEATAPAGGGNGNNNHGIGTAAWQDVPELASLPQSSLRMMEVSGRSILFCRLGESYYAYGNDCPGCGQPLEGAQLALTNLVCPHCRQRYDMIRAGRGLDQPSLNLEPFPLLVEQGMARVRISELEFRNSNLKTV
jgi:nitrite reductase/ring-hydroxylating ferredoxin subunit